MMKSLRSACRPRKWCSKNTRNLKAGQAGLAMWPETIAYRAVNCPSNSAMIREENKYEKRKRVQLPVFKASGGVQPGVDLNCSGDLEAT